jgi:hypothetical protein
MFLKILFCRDNNSVVVVDLNIQMKLTQLLEKFKGSQKLNQVPTRVIKVLETNGVIKQVFHIFWNFT